MIYAKDGHIDVNGNMDEVLEDWCLLTHSIFLKSFGEESNEKMKEFVNFIIENQEELTKNIEQ